MHSYGARDVEKLLRLPRRTIRALIDAGFVTPARGPRQSWLFSFQDLIVLRTAQSLANAKIPAKRISAALKELRRQLPESMPLSGLAIGAVGKRVVVRDGAGQRQIDSGQYLLSFEGNPEAGSLSVIERAPAPAVDDWFEKAAELEPHDANGAIEAYRKGLAAQPERTDARINLGRLLHEAGHLKAAEQVYREALAAGAQDALVHYNLGVVLDDMARGEEALAAYAAALQADPGLADCHYNLALLCEKLKKPREAIRHMAQYRRLTARRS